MSPIREVLRSLNYVFNKYGLEWVVCVHDQDLKPTAFLCVQLTDHLPKYFDMRVD